MNSTTFEPLIDCTATRALLLKLALLLVCARPASAADEATIESTQLAIRPHGTLCRHRVTNRSMRFIDEFTLAVAGGSADVPPGPQLYLSYAPNAMAHWHVANRERVMSDHVHWAGDAPDIALGPGDAIEVEQFFQPDLDSKAPRPSEPFRCTNVVVQVHTVAQRPAHVTQPRLVLAIADAKAARLPPPNAARVRVSATLSVHNNGPSDAVLSLGWMCAVRDPSRLGLFAIDAAGNETRLRPEVDVMRCIQSSAPPPGNAVRRGETFSTTVTRATDTPLKPGRYRLVLRYRGNGDPIMEGDEAVGRMWSGEAESTPVMLVVP